MARDLLHQGRVAGLEAPGDESREASVLVLERADGLEVLDDVLVHQALQHGQKFEVVSRVHQLVPSRIRPGGRVGKVCAIATLAAQREIAVVRRVVDQYDCATLALERQHS